VRTRNTTRHVWQEEGVTLCCGIPAYFDAVAEGKFQDDDGISRLCFVVMSNGHAQAYVCLAVRSVLSQSTSWCTTDRQCPSTEFCLRNTEAIVNNHLIEIGLCNEKSVMFLGSPEEIARSVELADTVALGSAPPVLPVILARFLRYLASISAALAVLNILPAYSLDGQHALSAWLGIVFPESRPQGLVMHATAGVLLTVTGLLAVNVAGSLLLVFL
jgi:S2P endopeptidase